MNQHIPFKRIVIASLGAAFMSAGASALADPPSRVARLAYVSGPVSFAPAGDNVWETAALNRPLISGDRLWVEPGARDEVQVSGAALRMGGGTLVTLLNNDDRVTQLQLSLGRLNVHVRRIRPNDVFEIDTPNLALSIRQPGDYRIEVDPAGNATMVAVRRGQAEAYGDGNAYRLASGQAYSFGGTDLRDARYARPLLDDFDRWSDARERRIDQARSARYVSPDLIGYEDLDEQGTWRVVPNYGNVWMPAHVGRDWAPYRDGHWSYVQPWGWTWVDDAPWGYAVSHYGRWARFNDGWGWVPGPRTASPVYAPALVAFVNLGTGSYAPRERPVAWFPLAPREVYRPSYRASPNYLTSINVTNTAVDRRQIMRDDRRGEYANRHAVTAVPASAFVQAQPVSRAAMAVPVAALAAAAIAHNAPVAPERESMHGRRGAGNQPPQAVMERQVLARNAPPRIVSQTPMPQQQASQAAPVMPAPRMLPQDRRGNRQFGALPAPGAAPVVQQQAAVPAPLNAHDARQDEMRQHGQRNMPQVAAPLPGQVAPAPALGLPVQANERDTRREQMRQHGQREAEQAARMQAQQVRAQQQEQQARMQQQQAREQEQRGRAQQQEQQARMQQQQAREQEQRGRAQQQEQQARMQQQQAREQEQRGRAQQQEQQARMQQQQAREQEQRGRAQQQEQQARMQQQQAREQEQRGRAQQQEQAQARAQVQAAQAAQAAQSAAQAQAAQARAQAQAQAAQAQANQAKAQAQQASAAASAPAAPEHGHGHGRDRKNEKEQQN